MGIYRYTTQKQKSCLPTPRLSLWERMALARGKGVGSLNHLESSEL